MAKIQLFFVVLLWGTITLLPAQNPTEKSKPKGRPIHEFWLIGSHANELAKGNYVIVAQVTSEADAKKLIDTYKKLEYPVPVYGYQSSKRFWLIGFTVEGDIPEAQAAHKNYKAYSLYKSAWLLTIHD